MNLNYLLKIAIIACLYSSLKCMDSFLPEYALRVIKECHNRDINTIYIGDEHTLPVLHYALYSDMHSKKKDTKLLQVLTLFLEKGADPSLCDTVGLTAVHCGISYNTRAEAIDLMLNTCNPNVKDKAIGDTPLHFILRVMKDLSFTNKDIVIQKNNNTSEESHQNHLGIVTKLLERGANPCLLNNDNETVFHLIAAKNRLDVAQLILPNKIQIQCIITILILNKNKNCIICQVPKRLLLNNIVSETLPPTLRYIALTDYQNISLAQKREALKQRSKSIKICINKNEKQEKKQWIHTGGKTAYEIAQENKSNNLAEILKS